MSPPMVRVKGARQPEAHRHIVEGLAVLAAFNWPMPVHQQDLRLFIGQPGSPLMDGLNIPAANTRLAARMAGRDKDTKAYIPTVGRIREELARRGINGFPIKNCSRRAFSHHLKVVADAGLIIREPIGPRQGAYRPSPIAAVTSLIQEGQGSLLPPGDIWYASDAVYLGDAPVAFDLGEPENEEAAELMAQASRVMRALTDHVAWSAGTDPARDSTRPFVLAVVGYPDPRAPLTHPAGTAGKDRTELKRRAAILQQAADDLWGSPSDMSRREGHQR